MSWLLITAIVLPIFLAILAVTPLRRCLPILALLAPLPPLVLLLSGDTVLELPWLLLGLRLGVDALSAPFLLLVGILWLAAAVYARSYLGSDARSPRFYLFFLLTLAGNIGVVLALDAISFYLFFTLMSFAAYGLIVHNGTIESLRAGKVYLILALAGEVLLLAAIVLIAAALGVVDLRELPAALAASSAGEYVYWLVLAGFAIKLGVVPLHVWLPLAHPSAPIPASAILSGVLLKTGLLGWLRFLPFGELALPELGQLCMLLGALTAFYGVFAGLMQYRPKTVLAYSSISQMGLVTLLAGVGLSAPQHWPEVLFTLILFSLHHGFAKGALFLGLGAVTRRRSLWLLALPALALVGAPLTSGAIAKFALKDAVAGQQLALPLNGSLEAIDIAAVLSLSSIATGFLLLRFFYLAWPREDKPISTTGLTAPCVALVLIGLLVPWAWALQHQPELINNAFDDAYVRLTLTLLSISAAFAALTWLLWRATGAGPLMRLPEGDIIALGHGCRRAGPALLRLAQRPLGRGHRHLPLGSFRLQLRLLLEKSNNDRVLLLVLVLLFVVFVIV